MLEVGHAEGLPQDRAKTAMKAFRRSVRGSLWESRIAVGNRSRSLAARVPMSCRTHSKRSDPTAALRSASLGVAVGRPRPWSRFGRRRGHAGTRVGPPNVPGRESAAAVPPVVGVLRRSGSRGSGTTTGVTPEDRCRNHCRHLNVATKRPSLWLIGNSSLQRSSSGKQGCLPLRSMRHLLMRRSLRSK